MRNVEPMTNTLCKLEMSAIFIPSHRAPAFLPSARVSTWRSRVSTLFEPMPRMNLFSRNSSSSVWCADANAPIESAPCSNLISLRPCATNSSACCHSTSIHCPPCLIIGRVSRSSEFKPSYEKRSLSDNQHSLMPSFSSGKTRITRSCFTCTTMLDPKPSCGATDLRRDNSQLRAV